MTQKNIGAGSPRQEASPKTTKQNTRDQNTKSPRGAQHLLDTVGLPKDNAEFLRVLGIKTDSSNHLWLASFAKDPATAGDAEWGGRAATVADAEQLLLSHNNYFSTSLFRTVAGKRQKSNVARPFVVVLDDPKDIKVAPTYIIETSEGNYQYGYLITNRNSADDVGELLNALKNAGHIKMDRSGNNPVRYVRLPYGTNTKAGKAWRCRLTAWDPDAWFTVDLLRTEFLGGLDRSVARVTPKPRTMGAIHEGSRDDQLASLAGRMRVGGMSESTIAGALIDHNAEFCKPPLPEAQVRKIAKSVARYPPGDDVSLLPPREPYSHAALAYDFEAENLDRVRYLPQRGRWLGWNGVHWKLDEAGNVLDLFRDIARRFSINAMTDPALGKRSARARMARTLESLAYLTGGEGMARASPRLTLTIDALDADPHLLNTPGGVIDLRTGVLRPHNSGDLITRVTNVSVGKARDCPRFDKFLQQIAVDAEGKFDPELAAYLRRALGACLFGADAVAGDHWLLFLHGSGRNGKNTLLDLVVWILGGYAKTVHPQVLMADTHGNRHPTEMANLHGVRLALSSEIAEGARWAESQIKSLTGDAMISARFMRQDLFEFKRTHRHVILGNHRPLLDDPGAAMAARLRLVPFHAAFLGNKADTKLPDKLRAEAPGVLALLVEGAKEYYGAGRLANAAAVDTATSEYLESQSTFDMWIAECCEQGATRKANSTELYNSYSQWTHRRGEDPKSQTRWADQMKAAHFDKSRSKHGNSYQGIALLVEQ